jgi:hypothetical protein
MLTDPNQVGAPPTLQIRLHIQGGLFVKMNWRSLTTFIQINRLPESRDTGNKILEVLGLPSKQFH